MTAKERTEARKKAGFRENYAMQHGKEHKTITGGEVCYKFTYSSADAYQDANGATYNATRGTWTN